MLEKLKEQNIKQDLLDKVLDMKNRYDVDNENKYRIPHEQVVYMGKEIWEQAITAILQGENILLVGPKSTGKNLLANNLSELFGRPSWNVSLNINSDESQLLGIDTFKNNEVLFRDGPITSVAKLGGFAILDEVNMSKNEALSILHSTLDDRRILDVPGYDLINLHPMTRFIATMNYGYLGTRELNEALVSRFMVIELPLISDENLSKLIKFNYPTIKDEYVGRFIKLFKDIELKVQNSEISSRALDLRGLLASIGSIQMGLNVRSSLDMGIVNKSFDKFEKELLTDLVKINFTSEIKKGDIFDV